MKIVKLFYNKNDVFLFMILVVVFSVIFIMMYRPIGVEGSSSMVGLVNGFVYKTLLVLVGYLILLGSHIGQYFVIRKKSITLLGLLGWFLAEMLVIAMAITVTSYILRAHDGVGVSMLFGRISVMVVSVLIIPYIVANLVVIVRVQNRQINYLTELNSLNKNNVQQAQVAAKPDTLSFVDRGGRFAFSTRKSNVLFIESADNYCNIHYLNDGREDYFILHNSMKNVDAAYSDRGFMRCHRCFLVNMEKVKSAKKTKDGLVVELCDSEVVVPVSKTYASKVLAEISSSPVSSSDADENLSGLE